MPSVPARARPTRLSREQGAAAAATQARAQARRQRRSREGRPTGHVGGARWKHGQRRPVGREPVVHGAGLRPGAAKNGFRAAVVCLAELRVCCLVSDLRLLCSCRCCRVVKIGDPRSLEGRRVDLIFFKTEIVGRSGSAAPPRAGPWGHANPPRRHAVAARRVCRPRER